MIFYFRIDDLPPGVDSREAERIVMGTLMNAADRVMDSFGIEVKPQFAWQIQGPSNHEDARRDLWIRAKGGPA